VSSLANTRRLLLHSALYGVADALVIAVGGLLLLPLYTRTLTQADFGLYVIVKTNAELFTYVLYFGLPSAVARVYFDYRKEGRHVEYMSSVVGFFAILLLGFALVCYVAGESLWRLLSPGAPAYPYLWFSLAIASLGFFANLGPLWLRLEERVYAFTVVQVCSSLLLGLAAVLCLVTLQLGVRGVFAALLIGSACSAAVLPWLFGRRFRFVIEAIHVRESLRFAAPIVVGYIAYFVLNRIATLILQRHVAVEELAIFGLAQQLAMVVTIAGTSFGKALQPAVFAAEPAAAQRLLRRSGQLFILLMFAITSVAMLFGPEIFALIAPARYAAGYEIFLILAWANLAYSVNLIFNTALIYLRRPRSSLAVSIVGAVLAVALGLWLIPLLRLRGAAFATAAAFVLMILFAQWVTRGSMGGTHIGAISAALVGACLLGMAAAWIHEQGFALSMALTLKAGICMVVAGAIYLAVKMSERDEVKCST
jgi:O-antigen/teichoic acid export membrane protein